MKLTFNSTVLAIAVTFITALSTGTAHANLLTNGSFETGNLSGWTQALQFNGTTIVFTSSLPYFPTYDGAWQLGLDTSSRLNNLTPQIYQDIATTIGDSYNISFAIHPNVDKYSSGWFAVTAGIGTPSIGSWTPLDFSYSGPTSPEAAYQSLSKTFTATDTTTRVAFSWNSAWVMDNAVLTKVASAPVPLPAAAWLFGSGLLGLAGVARRKVA